MTEAKLKVVTPTVEELLPIPELRDTFNREAERLEKARSAPVRADGQGNEDDIGSAERLRRAIVGLRFWAIRKKPGF